MARQLRSNQQLCPAGRLWPDSEHEASCSILWWCLKAARYLWHLKCKLECERCVRSARWWSLPSGLGCPTAGPDTCSGQTTILMQKMQLLIHHTRWCCVDSLAFWAQNIGIRQACSETYLVDTFKRADGVGGLWQVWGTANAYRWQDSSLDPLLQPHSPDPPQPLTREITTY